MANSYTEYTASSVTTSTQFATPSYITGRGATDISVTVAGVTQASSAYTLTGTNITFAADSLPADGAKILITRATSQNARINTYSENTVLTSTQLNTDGEQSFMMAQEAIDQASKTDFGAQTFYTSGTTTPSSGSIGDLFFNTSTGLLSVYNGSLWESVNNKGHKQSFTTTGDQTVFSPTNPVDENTLVFLNGVLQNKGGDYTTTATTVTFGSTVAAANIVEIVSFPNSVSGFSVTDNAKATFGTGEDLTIHSDGTHGYITEKNTTGNLFIDSNHLVVRQGTGYPTGDDATPQDFNRIVATGGTTDGGVLLFAGGESSYDSSDATNYDPNYGRWRMFLKPKSGSTAGGATLYGQVRISDATGSGTQTSVTMDSGADNSGDLVVENKITINKGDLILSGATSTGTFSGNVDVAGSIKGNMRPNSSTETTRTQSEFSQYKGMRTFYSGASTATWTLFSSPTDGDTWVIMNVSDHNILISKGSQTLKYIDGSAVNASANRTIASGGIAEIVYDGTTSCYYIFGDGIS